MLDRARAAGVKTILAIGSGTGTNRLDAAIPFAEQHDWIYATVGIHPHDVNDVTEETFRAARQRWRRHPRVIAWGEMGLDYHYDHVPPDVQKRVFRRQLDQAERRSCRSSFIAATRGPIASQILEQDWSLDGLGGIFHCFSGNARRRRVAAWTWVS